MRRAMSRARPRAHFTNKPAPSPWESLYSRQPLNGHIIALCSSSPHSKSSLLQKSLRDTLHTLKWWVCFKKWDLKWGTVEPPLSWIPPLWGYLCETFLYMFSCSLWHHLWEFNLRSTHYLFLELHQQVECALLSWRGIRQKLCRPWHFKPELY